MNIRGLTVCVNYADLLARGLELWHTGLDRLIVVTSTTDTETQNLCNRLNVECYTTDIFYANGARFNKAAGLSEAIAATRLREDADWLLTFDADIVPPADWRICVERAVPRSGNLYGTYRYQVPENAVKLVLGASKRMPQSWVLGFFMLFHNSDPNVASPVFDLHWGHCGNYDTVFCRRWPKANQIILPIPMFHLGNERENWMGRGTRDDLREMLAKRHGHEDWEKEKMAQPPIIKVQ